MKNLAVVILIWLIGAGAVEAQTPGTVDGSSSVQGTTETGDTNSGASRLPMLQHRNQRYQLHSADVLQLTFPYTPEFNQNVTVQPDGYISLRGAEDIRVEGQTLPEVSKSLRIAYSRVLHDPVINIELKDFEKPYFIVGGEVGHPGKFDLRDETTAAQAVAIAGGLRDSAKHSQILLFHRVPKGWMQVKRLNLKKMLNDANLDEDAYLQAGDFLYVPKNTFSKIQRFIPSSSMGMYANPALH
ncbi:MAG: polysaccharide export protein [Candidatus Acidoferrum typicum]|nr:polysaccharide export protein [Candidatus Acidoferrum typicum]